MALRHFIVSSDITNFFIELRCERWINPGEPARLTGPAHLHMNGP